MSRPLGTADELERRRCHALALLRQGQAPARVAYFLGVDRSSVYRWRQAAAPGGPGLAARPHPPQPCRLADDQLGRLEALLAQGATAHGWPNGLWTTERVAVLIRRHFGVGYHHDHVGRFLRRRLGWTPQKPRRRARERDEQAIRRWQSVDFPVIAADARQRGAHLVFLDESGYQLTPTVRRTWAPRGQTPVLDAWDKRDRISAISAITVSPVARRLNLYFDLMEDNHTVKGTDVVSFLKHLKGHLPGPLTVLWDGARIHRCEAVREYLAEHPEIRAERLPAYAPELNPDELVWAWTKYGRLGNLAAQNTDWLRDYIINELVYIKAHPQLLASFIDGSELPFD